MPDNTVPPSPEPPVDALPFDLDHVPENLRIKAQTELLEDENKVQESLKLLRSKLENEPNLRWQDEDLFLLAFLRVKKFDVDKAFSLIKGFYTNIGKHGDVFYNLDFDRLRILMEENLLYFFPYRDREGSVVFMYRCGQWNIDSTTAHEHMMCTFLGILQALSYPSTQIAGFHLIAEFKGYSVKHLMHTTPSVIKFFTDMIQNAFPVRMRGFHLVHQNHLFSYIWPLVKVFLSKKLRSRIHFHGSDMKSVHKFFHPSILPAELEGEMPPFDNTPWRQKMLASTDYLKHALSFGYDYYLRKDWKRKSRRNSESHPVTS